MKVEYDALDTVWFMAGSLFKNYPYDVPTEVFSFEVFKQAFAAVQASVVHLQVCESLFWSLLCLHLPTICFAYLNHTVQCPVLNHVTVFK